MALMADHLIVIGQGSILADCSMREFMEDHAQSFVRVKTNDVGVASQVLVSSSLEVSRHHGATGPELHVQGLDAAGIGELLGRHGIVLHELTLVSSSLEDAFMTLTADSVEYAAHPAAQEAQATR
jgi:ABC-2 type transport system ATP-binding protein